MSIGLPPGQNGAGQYGSRQVATGPGRGQYHMHMPAGLVRPGQRAPGKQHRRTEAREHRASPALALATRRAKPSNNKHVAWCKVRPCTVPYPAYVALCPCACVACRIQGSMLATRTTGPPWPQPTTGSSVCLAPCHMSMGRVPSPACVAPCAQHLLFHVAY